MNRRLLCSVILTLALAACAPAGVPVAEAGVRVWIDQPLAGGEYAAGETVSIRWHAAAVDGIQQVEVRINGEGLGVAQDFDHAAPLVTEAQEWMPAGPGEYLIQVIATGTNGAAGVPAEKRIRVLGNAVAAGGIVRGAVYADLNTDGDPDDPGEGPLADVTVTLSQCADRSQATGADGTFDFEGLPAGTCLVAVDKPGWRFAGTFPAGIDYPARAASDPALPTAFSLFMSTDVGGIVRGVVYSDLNLDGDAQDPGEAPLDGVTVTLADCAPAAMQVTGADGVFDFEDLPAGTCLLSVDKPGWVFAGTYPAEIGYPARAASDPALPTAFAFYMAPVQGGVTPSPSAPPSTGTATPIPPPPATWTPTPRPTVSMPTDTPVPMPTPYLFLWADVTTLTAGQCTNLRWDSGNIQSLYLDGEGVAGTDVRMVCPATTTTYTLVANTAGGQISREATITVTAPPVTPTPTPQPPTRTPSPTPDTVGPPAPHIVGPTGGVMLECIGPVTLDWDAPYDPSGISNYRVRLQRWTGAEWIDQHIWDPVSATQVDARNDTDCGIAYRWRVLARDGAGNGGDVSEYAQFAIALP